MLYEIHVVSIPCCLLSRWGEARQGEEGWFGAAHRSREPRFSAWVAPQNRVYGFPAYSIHHFPYWVYRNSFLDLSVLNILSVPRGVCLIPVCGLSLPSAECIVLCCITGSVAFSLMWATVIMFVFISASVLLLY